MSNSKYKVNKKSSPLLSSPEDADMRFQGMMLQPIGSIKAQPTLVKECAPGTKVGYSGRYEVGVDTTEPEYIATFPIGYGDGVFRSLSSGTGGDFKGYIVRDATGESGDRTLALRI